MPKFKVELTVEFADFVINYDKSKSMINALQREQIESALIRRLADMNPEIHNVYKQRTK